VMGGGPYIEKEPFMEGGPVIGMVFFFWRRKKDKK
jgi:hypothetical protein